MTKTFSQKTSLAQLQKTFLTLQDSEIAQKISELSPSERLVAINLLKKETLAEVFAILPQDIKEDLIDSLTQADITTLLDELDSDDLVDVLQELPSNLVTKLLGHIPKERRKIINQLLHYPDDSLGSLMSVDYIAVRQDTTKDMILEKIKQSSAGHEHLSSIYILDEKRQLLGYVYLVDILRLEGQNISELIYWNPITVNTLDDQEKAAHLFHQHSLLSLPVSDSEGRLVGIITADDIFEIITEEIHEDYSLMQGLGKTETPYLETPIWKLSQKRVVWLLFLMVSATFTGFIIESYETILSSTVALAAFIPMLMDSGGNSGSQSSTLIIQALTLQEIRPSDLTKVVWKEFRVGVCVGLILGLVNSLRMLILTDEPPLIILTVSLTLFLTIILAKLVGGILPIIAKLLKQDPAVMAGPLVTTVVDAFALMIYFKIAQLLLGIG